MFQRIIHLGKNTFALWSKERASSRGAAIAFYTVTSIAPIILLIIAIAGLVFGEDAARGAIFGQFSGLLGPQAAGVLQKTIAGAASKGGGIAASVISVITLVLSASGVFVELEDAVNAVWGAKQQGGLKGMARARLMSLGLVLGLGFFLIVSLVVETALKAFTSMFPFGAVVGLVVGFLVSLAITAAMFTAILKYLPAKPIAWRDVWVGGVVTAVLFEIGKILLGIYLGRSSSFSSLGAAGALIALLFWVYYTAQIFLFGAAFTRVYAEGDKALADSGNDRSDSAQRDAQTRNAPEHARPRQLESVDRR
jgi:membrane protein